MKGSLNKLIANNESRLNAYAKMKQTETVQSSVCRLTSENNSLKVLRALMEQTEKVDGIVYLYRSAKVG